MVVAEEHEVEEVGAELAERQLHRVRVELLSQALALAGHLPSVLAFAACRRIRRCDPLCAEPRLLRCSSTHLFGCRDGRYCRRNVAARGSRIGIRNPKAKGLHPCAAPRWMRGTRPPPQVPFSASGTRRGREHTLPWLLTRRRCVRAQPRLTRQEGQLLAMSLRHCSAGRAWNRNRNGCAREAALLAAAGARRSRGTFRDRIKTGCAGMGLFLTMFLRDIHTT